MPRVGLGVRVRVNVGRDVGVWVGVRVTARVSVDGADGVMVGVPVEV